MKKSTAGIIAGAGLVALAFTGGTFALWTDTTEAGGGIITAGDLEITSAEPQWYDVSDGRAPVAIDLGDFRTVPGDTLQLQQDVTLTLVGDNLEAEASVTLPDAASADAGFAENIDVSYRLLDEDGAEVAASVAGAPVSFELEPNSTGDYTIEVDFAFASGTPDRVATNATATIAGTTVTLKQTR